MYFISNYMYQTNKSDSNFEYKLKKYQETLIYFIFFHITILRI